MPSTPDERRSKSASSTSSVGARPRIPSTRPTNERTPAHERPRHRPTHAPRGAPPPDPVGAARAHRGDRPVERLWLLGAPRERAPGPGPAALCLGGQAGVLLALAVLLSSRLTTIAGGAISVVLFGASWISGVMASIAGFLDLDALAGTIQVARFIVPLDGLWKGAVYALEPPAFILLATSAGERAARPPQNNPVHSSPPPDPAYRAFLLPPPVLRPGLA